MLPLVIWRWSRQIQPLRHEPLGQCPQQGIDNGNQRKDGDEYDNAQGIVGTEKRRGAEAGIVKVLIPAERDKDCRHKGCHLPDKADDKVGGNADEQPLLGKLRGKGTGQICVQQCARDKGQYNQKHCRPDGDILGSDAAEIQCKPAATDRVGSQHAAKCKKYHAEQRPYRAADDLSSNVLPNGHGQSQHQVPALAQQAVKLLNFNKKADGEHNKKAYGRCQCQQGHGDPGQRQPVGGVLDKMAQNISKNVQHKHARRNGQNNTACGFELIM